MLSRQHLVPLKLAYLPYCQQMEKSGQGHQWYKRVKERSQFWYFQQTTNCGPCCPCWNSTKANLQRIWSSSIYWCSKIGHNKWAMVKHQARITCLLSYKSWDSFQNVLAIIWKKEEMLSEFWDAMIIALYKNKDQKQIVEITGGSHCSTFLEKF